MDAEDDLQGDGSISFRDFDVLKGAAFFHANAQGISASPPIAGAHSSSASKSTLKPSVLISTTSRSVCFE